MTQSQNSEVQSRYHDLYLYIAPIKKQNDFKLHKPFRAIAHWAICVDGRCYELARDHQSQSIKRSYHTSFLPEKAWKDVRDADDRKYEKGLLGRTLWSEEEIESCATAIWEQLLKRNYTLWEGQDCQYFARVLTECIGDETAIDKFDTFNKMLEAGYSFQAGFIGSFGASFSMLAVPDPTLTTQTLGAIAVMSAVAGSGTVYLMERKRNRSRKHFIAKWRR